MTLRFADSIILPLNTTQYALELEDYLSELSVTPIRPYHDIDTPL